MILHARTDLASEAHISLGAAKLNGVRAERLELSGLSVTAVEVLDDEGAGALGKPKGKYFTLSLPSRFEHGGAEFPAVVSAVSELIRRCFGSLSPESVLVAALGNPDITPDAVGSLAASSLLVTRHLKQSGQAEFQQFCSVALCRTGVLGTTGVESAAQIASLTQLLEPELVIVIDALAGADPEGLCRSIQICDSGISPGSGVGNDRAELSAGTLGVPVVAIGAPTVVDAAAFSDDASVKGMFVTPRGIDSSVRALGRVIGYGIDLAVHSGLTVEDIDMLTG